MRRHSFPLICWLSLLFDVLSWPLFVFFIKLRYHIFRVLVCFFPLFFFLSWVCLDSDSWTLSCAKTETWVVLQMNTGPSLLTEIGLPQHYQGVFSSSCMDLIPKENLWTGDHHGQLAFSSRFPPSFSFVLALTFGPTPPKNSLGR